MELTVSSRTYIFCLIAITLVFSIFTTSEALSDKKQPVSSQYKCKGKALCINGTVTKIVDGDTLNVKEIKNGKLHKIRLSLTSTPELNTMKGVKASIFLKKICPAGSNVLVDQDDGQIGGSYDRMLGKVICVGKNINAELLYNGHATISKKFCKKSEFATEDWARKYGCALTVQTSENKQTSQPSVPAIQTKENSCDPSYPDVCIPSFPPDLDCGEIQYSNFKVLPPDPHKFDGDKD